MECTVELREWWCKKCSTMIRSLTSYQRRRHPTQIAASLRETKLTHTNADNPVVLILCFRFPLFVYNMNQGFGIAVVAAILAICQASLFCQHLSVPGKNEAFGTVKIIGKKANVDTPIYQLVDAGEPETNTVNKAEVFRLLTRNDLPECGGRGCVVEITESSPKSHNTMMYGTNILGNFYPPGFYRTEKSVRYYCALISGDCGSAVPIYRYYKWTIGGLFYAYSTDDSVEIPGFVLEPMPLCYGWELPETEEGSGASVMEVDDSAVKIVKADCASESMPKKESMKELQVYFNEQPGALKDHYYTTKKPTLAQLNDDSSDFNGYRLMDDEIGMVITDEQKSGCTCLTRLVQMKSEKTDGFMPHRDHALMSDASEIDPQGGTQYDPLPEDVYCASKMGACGASVPLRKYFNLFDLDTTYTVNSSNPAPMAMAPSPVLCYIWPLDDATRAAKIAAKIAATSTTSTTTTTTTEAPTTTVEAATNATESAETTEAASTTTEAVTTTEAASTTEAATTTTTAKPTKKEEKKSEKKEEKKSEKKESNDAKKSEKKEKKTTEAPATTTEKATEAPTTTEKATTAKATEATTTTAKATEATTTAAPSTTEKSTTAKATEATATTEKATKATTTTAAASSTTEAAKATESTTASSTTTAKSA
uniref:CUB domain-containing protein n=1 Tax=Panagrellus redivivus TaxID=6233 RepID=A0A7E4VTG6_PANRE